MRVPLVLSQADHELAEPVVSWKAVFIDAIPPAIRLTASVQSDPPIPIFPTQGPTATTLVIQMDAQVAIALAEQIRDLARSMGWPLPLEDEPQA
jgi:hypothetical protein